MADDDLSTLDTGNLVARLALAKKRLRRDATGVSKLEPATADSADSATVLDERSKQPAGLNLTELQAAYSEALDLAVAARVERDEHADEVRRLRALIKAMGPVAFGKCPRCGVPEVHAPECPWSAIRTEATKP